MQWPFYSCSRSDILFPNCRKMLSYRRMASVLYDNTSSDTGPRPGSVAALASERSGLLTLHINEVVQQRNHFLLPTVHRRRLYKTCPIARFRQFHPPLVRPQLENTQCPETRQLLSVNLILHVVLAPDFFSLAKLENLWNVRMACTMTMGIGKRIFNRPSRIFMITSLNFTQR